MEASALNGDIFVVVQIDSCSLDWQKLGMMMCFIIFELKSPALCILLCGIFPLPYHSLITKKMNIHVKPVARTEHS